MEIEDFIRDYICDADEGLKTLVTFFLNLVMQYEAEQQAGVGRYQRSPTRTAVRNGSKPRSLLTKLGKLILQKPQFRDKPFETVIFERYSRVEQALINTILESCQRRCKIPHFRRDTIPHLRTFMHTHEGCGNAEYGGLSRDPRSLQSRTNHQLDRPEDWV